MLPLIQQRSEKQHYMDLGSKESRPLLGEVIAEDLPQIPYQPSMERFQDVHIVPVPAVVKIASCLCCPIVGLGACYTVQPKQEVAVMHLGSLTELQKEPGLHWTWPCMRETRSINTSQRSVSMPSMKVADQSGSPVLVSAILNYHVSDAKQAIFNVTNVDSYVLNNAEAVLKQVVGRYSYYQLKSETPQINRAMLNALQPMCVTAGVTVSTMLLNELNYAPEVASGMLRTQQAGALLEARQIIVEGAVKIALDAVKMIEKEGMTLSEESKARMVTNLLTVSVSEADTTPTLSL